MAKESRVRKSLLNARVNVIFYMMTLAVSFFSRKTFLDMLGADFMGFTGTIGNLLGFLNIAEMGIVSAIGFVLYKPLFEGDRQTITEIISVLGHIYRIVGLVILGGGLVLGCLLPVIYPDTGFSWGVIYFAYFSFLASSLLTYFTNYRQTLLTADQRNYVVAAYSQTAYIVKTLLQIWLAYRFANYYVWLAMELVSGILYSIYLNYKINKVYPWLHSDKSEGRRLLKKYPEIMRKARQLLIHKIGAFVQSQTSSLIIYLFVSLKVVAYYNNYTIIVSKLMILVNNLLGSTNAGVGNLIAEGDRKNIIRVFWELQGLQFFVAGTLSFGLVQLSDSFITLWLGREYVLSMTVTMLIVVSMFIGITRNAVEQFLFGHGLFADVWAPVAESLVCLTVAIVGGSLWGLPGVLLGSATSLLLIVVIWKPYYLYRSGFKLPYRLYVFGYLKHLAAVIVPGVALHYLLALGAFAPSASFWHWTGYALLNVVSYSVITFLLMYAMCPAMRTLVKRFPLGRFFRRR